MDNAKNLANETSYTSLSEEIRRHSHLITPQSPQYETEYEAKYTQKDEVQVPHSDFILKSLSPRRHKKRVEEIWNNLHQSTAELLSHLDPLVPITHLAAEEVKSRLLRACEEVKKKEIDGPNLGKLHRMFLAYESRNNYQEEERKHYNELYTNIDEVLVNNEVLNFINQYQKLQAEF